MIQWHFNNCYNRGISIFSDKEFHESRKVLDALMKKGAAAGLLKPKKKAVTINLSNEEQMWRNGTIGSLNPKQLVNTLIYHLRLHLSLRALQEHIDLEFGEFHL
jgi:hypothetical protein